MSIEERLSAHLEALRSAGAYRYRVLLPSDSTWSLNFSSNDYLGLRRDDRLGRGYQEGFQRHSSGSCGSMVLSGYQAAHQSVERAFASFLNVDDALLLTSGYTANLAVMALLKSLDVHCLMDKGLHASFYDGLALYKPSYRRYLHHDLASLASQLLSVPKDPLVLTEGIFSMSGKRSDLSAIKALCNAHQSRMIVDEAHSFGVMGDHGRGACDLYQLDNEVLPLRIIPLGKAFASQGAIIAGSGPWIEGLIQVARSYIYSTGVSPALAYGIERVLEIVAQSDERRRKLSELILYFRQKRQNSALHWSESDTAIQHLKLGHSKHALYFSKALTRYGIYCLAVRPPTVSEANTGLRVMLNYDHQPEDIDRLFQALEEIKHDDIPF